MRGSKQPKPPAPPADPLAALLPSALQATHAWAVVLVGSLAGLAFLNSLGNGFAFDDRVWIVQNYLVRDVTNIGGIFTSPYVPKEYPDGMYRPLLTLSYALNYAVSGLRPFSYHVVNVLLHAANSALVYALTWQLFRQRGLALLTAAAFALHPIHTEAVANVVGRGELLAAAFIFLAWSLYLERDSPPKVPRLPSTSPSPPRGEGWDEGWTPADRWPRGRRTLLLAGSVGSFAVALLSKEHAIVLPGLLLLGDALRVTQRTALAAPQPLLLPPGEEGGMRGRPQVAPGAPARLAGVLGRQRLVGYLPYLAVAGGYLVVRLTILGTLTMPVINPVMNPIAYADTSTRLVTSLKVLNKYLYLLLVPSRLSADYSYSQVPLARSLLEPDVLFPLVIVGLVAWLLRRSAPAVPFGLLAFFVTILPVSNIFFPIGTIMGERFAYLPSLGFCLAFAGAVVAIVERLAPRRFAWLPLGAFGLLLAFYAGRTVIRNPVWATDLALWRAAVAASPNSVKAHLNLASALIDTGDLDGARQAVEASLRIFPTWGEVQQEFALIRQMQGPWEGAIAELQALVRSDPYAPEPHDRLARAYEAEGFLVGARRAFQRAAELALQQDKPRLHLGIVDFLVRYEKLPEAESWLERTVTTWPRFVDGHLYLGYVCLKRGKLAEARASFERALRLDPTSPKGHEGLGLVLKAEGGEGAERARK